MAAAALAAIHSAKHVSFVEDLISKDTNTNRLSIAKQMKLHNSCWNDFGGINRTRAIQKARIGRKASVPQIGKFVWNHSEDASESPSTSIHDQELEQSGKLDTIQELRALDPDLVGVEASLLEELGATSTQTIDDNASREPTLKENVWLLMSDQDSSTAAMGISVTVLTTICISCVAILLESLPELNHDNSRAETAFFVIETICVVIFSLEYIVRLWSCPRVGPFLLHPMNIIDVLAVLPYYISVILGVEFTWLTILRMLRMVRLLRFASGNESIKCVLLTMQESTDISVFMIFMLAIVVIVFASMEYSLERGDWDDGKDCYIRPGEDICTPFISIPESMWWCLVSVMMVGYGDIVPTTIPGKFIGSAACVVGIVVVALPASVLGANFSGFMAKHQRNVRKQKVLMEARSRGIQGVEKSREKVKGALAAWNEAGRQCLDSAAGALERCTQQQLRMWWKFVRPNGMETPASTPASTVSPISSPTSQALLTKSKVDGLNAVPVVGRTDLFDTMEIDFETVLSKKICQCFGSVEKVNQLMEGHDSRVRYIELLAKAVNVPLESHWDTLRADNQAAVKLGTGLRAEMALRGEKGAAPKGVYGQR